MSDILWIHVHVPLMTCFVHMPPLFVVIFCSHTSPCWPIFYKYNLFLHLDSLHMVIFYGSFCTYTSLCWPKFYKYPLMPSLYTTEFYGLFCIYTFPCELILIWVIFYCLHVHVPQVTSFVHVHPDGDVCSI